MPALPLKSEYRPTLGELLAPRWRRASLRGAHAVGRGGVALAVAAIAGAALTLASPTVSHGGPVPFSFSYGGAPPHRPAPGVVREGAARAEAGWRTPSRWGPSCCPPTAGRSARRWRCTQRGYIPRLAARPPGPTPGADGVRAARAGQHADRRRLHATPPTTSSTPPASRAGDVRAQRPAAPRSAGRARGLQIAMLTTVAGNRQVTSPLDVGVKGALEEPLGTFALE